MTHRESGLQVELVQSGSSSCGEENPIWRDFHGSADSHVVKSEGAEGVVASIAWTKPDRELAIGSSEDFDDMKPFVCCEQVLVSPHHQGLDAKDVGNVIELGLLRNFNL